MRLILLAVFIAAGCSVTSELQGLQELKVECESLELELAGLKAKKWTKIIDKQVELCYEHGFMTGKLESQKPKSNEQELVDEFQQ